MSEQVIAELHRTEKRLKEVCKSCGNFSKQSYDECGEHCLIYRLCWSLQDIDEEALKGASKIVELAV